MIAALAVHVVLLVLVWPGRPTVSQTTPVIRVRLLDVPQDLASEPALPQPAPPARQPAREPQRATRAINLPPAVSLPRLSGDDAVARAPADVAALPEVRAYNRDGSINVPDDFVQQLDAMRAKPDFIARAVTPSPLLAAKRPLKLRPNHFAPFWNGDDGQPLHESMWRHLTAAREFTAPWGGRYACVWVLVVVACADVPDKPWNPPQAWKPATEFDER